MAIMNESFPAHSAKNAAFRIVLIYIVLAAAWILFSDKFVASLSSNQSTITTLSIFKGWLFVAITGTILYLLINKNFAEQEAARKEIALSEERFSTVFNSSPLAIGLGSRDNGKLLDVNEAWLKMFGFQRTEVIGRTTSDLGLYVDSEQRDETIQMLLATGCLKNRELRLRRKSGEIFDVLYSAEFVEFAQDSYLLVMLSEITERKRVEAYRNMGRDILFALNGQEDLKEAIKEVIGIVRHAVGVDAVGIRLQHEDDFPYFYQEGFPQDFLQKENSLLTRNRDGGICRDESGNICLECTCGLVITGKTDPDNPLFTKGGSSWTNDSFPFLHVPPDQDPRTNPHNECIHQGFASVALIPIRAKGRIVGLLQLNDYRKDRFNLDRIEALEGIAENIGEAMLRKKAECELCKSKELVLNLIQSTDQGIYGVNLEGRCTFINRSALTMLGYEAEACLGSKMHDLVHHTHANRASFHAEDCPLCRARISGEGCRLENEVLWRKDGTFFFVEYSSYPVVENGTLSGAVVTFSDVTERKRAEEERVKLESQLHQAQKMESIACLAGGVAHDFNNKLSVILGHAEMAIMKNVPDQVRESLEEILKATRQSADLTRQLLAFARKQSIEPKVLDLNETISSMLKMLQRLIGEDIQLEWHPAENLGQVNLDPSQIDQVLANLCVNARDAITDDGRITIETGNRMFDDGYCTINPGFISGNYVEISVSDNGCGMDRATQSQIFEPFFTTKAPGKGTGLGLATVYGIIKQNKGFLHLYSEPGYGTTFKIYLPRYESEERPVLTESAIKPHLFGKETILLVEDDPSILKMTAMMLETQGYNLLSANSPDDAIETAKQYDGEIHLLISDVVMPGMNCRELAQRLHEDYPKLKCLYMSGYTADVIAHHGVLEKGLHFIQKPFSVSDVAAKLRSVLDGS